jgi:hypothetical protein
VLFNVETDRGDTLSGYLVGDGVDEVARLIVTHQGATVYEGLADSPRAPLALAGRHRTGRCGFELDETRVPGLGDMRDLAIHDVATGTLIYRRRQADHLARRVFRLETHLFPLWRLDGALNAKFQYAANRIEAAGRETTTQMFLLNQVDSVYLSGRVLYRSYSHQIEGHFDVVFTMHHPYEELAERLIVLAQIKSSGSAILGLRENMSLEPTMAFAQSLPIEDEGRLRRALRDMPEGVARVLANPVTRQLTTSAPEETPARGVVGRALTTLAGFAVVGLRRAPDAFDAALSQLCGLAAPETPPLPGVAALARILERCREADGLIEHDLALYAHVADACRKSGDAALQGAGVRAAEGEL